MTRDDLIDLIENAIDNVHDLDVTHRDYAEPVLLALRDLLRKENDK